MDIDDEAIGKWPNVAIEAGTDLKLAMPDGNRSVFDEPEEPEATPARFADVSQNILSGESYKLDTRELLEADELKPCPWCRKAPTLHYSDITEEWHVYCYHGDCMVRPYVFKLTKAEVIEAWNARADDAPISEKPAPSLKESTEDTQVLSDSREQLLVDAWKFVERWAVDDDDFCRPTTHLNCSKELRDLLDRQDAITRREFDGECEFCQSEVARLQNHVDDLKAEVEAQRKRANDAERGVLSEAWYVSRDRYEDDIAELKAERDELTNAINELQKKQPYCYNPEQPLDTLNTIGRYIDELTTERDELKPCNYCKDGGEPRIVNDGFFYVAGCHECGYTIGAYLTKESAIAAWNARADDAQVITSAEKYKLADSREQLEADIDCEIEENSKGTNAERSYTRKLIIGWLDRQAAITEREVCEYFHMLDRTDELEEQVDELTAERNEFADELKLDAIALDELRKQVDELTAERDELRAQLDTTRDVAREFRDERDELKHANSLLQSTIAELGLKVDEKQAELLEARASRKGDAVGIQLALARFAEEWVLADTRAQEQRCITYHAQQIAQMVDNSGGAE